MSNPNNALGTNGAYGGRTSVNAFNDVLATFKSRGVLSGWECLPDIGLTVSIGGNGTDRDVALAEDNVGNKTTVNNTSQAPISVTMPAAPATNSRVDAIVAYIESSPSATAETDNYTAVNLLVVSGTASATPTVPNDSDIRTAITADGASGSTAYYVILATVTIPSGTTDIDATMITAGTPAQLTSKNIDFTTLAFVYSIAPGKSSVGSSTESVVNQLTIPENGKYLVLCVNNINSLNNNLGDAYTKITVNGTGVDGSAIYFNNPGGSGFWSMGSFTNLCVIESRAGDVVRCVAKTGQNTMAFPQDRGGMCAVKIGE